MKRWIRRYLGLPENQTVEEVIARQSFTLSNDIFRQLSAEYQDEFNPLRKKISDKVGQAQTKRIMAEDTAMEKMGVLHKRRI